MTNHSEYIRKLKAAKGILNVMFEERRSIPKKTVLTQLSAMQDVSMETARRYLSVLTTTDFTELRGHIFRPSGELSPEEGQATLVND